MRNEGRAWLHRSNESAADPVKATIERTKESQSLDGRKGVGAALALLLLVAASPALAQPPRGPEQTARQEGAETTRRNETALVFAGTFDINEDATFFTLGFEYERRFERRFGLVTEAEYQFDAGSWIVAAPLVVHPLRGLKLFAGPGFEHADEAQDDEARDEDEGAAEDRSSTNFLIRVGGGYVVEFAERYSIGPTVSVDFVRERGGWATSLAFGITVGVAF